LDELVPSYEELERQYANDTDRLCNDHERIIEQILEEEEVLITSHRKHIDEVVDIVKEEMLLLNEVDKPGSDVEEYVKGIDQVLRQKMQMIQQVHQQVMNFYKHLKTEESMSKLYQ
jgi:kinesin family protein 2/24